MSIVMEQKKKAYQKLEMAFVDMEKTHGNRFARNG